MLIFLLSIIVRLPNINRPLSKHHEFITAISLRVINIWQDENASKYHFNPVMNYKGTVNKHINNWASTTGKMVDKKGNYYYVSHPQFAYILPYAIFKLFNVKASVLSIEIFHLILNLICVVFIYLIVCLLAQQKPFYKPYKAGLVGASLYLFNPGVLWFQCNTYMSDTLVHVLFIINVYIVLKLLMRKKYWSIKYLIYYAIGLFLMIYTSWLGIFFAFSIFIYSYIKLRKQSMYMPLNVTTFVITLSTLLLIYYQYQLISGSEAYLSQMFNRFTERGSMFQSHFFTKVILSILVMFKNYASSYLPLLLLISCFTILSLSNFRMKVVFTKNGYRFLWLSTLPVILLQLVLLNYIGHDFTSLYGSLFLAVLAAILYDKLGKLYTNKKGLNTLVVISIITSISMYYYINKPGDISLSGTPYAIDKNLGEYIAKEAKSDEVVFAKNIPYLSPQIIYYAHRNVKRVEDSTQAKLFLEKYHLKKGRLFIYSSRCDCFKNNSSIRLNTK